MKNERSGKRAASIAGRIERTLQKASGFNEVFVIFGDRDYADLNAVCTVSELRSLCGSVLTQSPDHPAKPAKRKRGKG